jgi:hypothetical protein
MLLALVALVIAGSASAANRFPPPPPPQPTPVLFGANEWGAVSPKFHAGHDGNRVFYASSLKQARRWAAFTSIQYTPSTYDFKRYGVLAIFYKGDWAGFTPELQTVAESAGGDLYAKIALQYFCHFPMICPPPAHGPNPQPWGMYVLAVIDKQSLVRTPQSVWVTTSLGF